MEMQPLDSGLILGRLQAGTLVRNEWGDGHERACLLAALAPECAKAKDASACPASVMPLWLANLTPLMDDMGTEEAWEPFVRRYTAVAARWYKLDASGWRRVFLGSLVAILEIARKYESPKLGDEMLALCCEDAAINKAACAPAGTAASAITRVLSAEDDLNKASFWMKEAALRVGVVAQKNSGIESITWDQMTAGILAAIEAECDRAEMA